MLPREFLARMYEKSRGEFDKYIVGDKSLDGFWRHLPGGDPRLSGHLVKRARGKSMVVPLRIHGDGVLVGKGKTKSMGIISLSSMTGAFGCTWDSRMLVFAMISDSKFKGGGSTMDLVWKINLWSLGVCAKRFVQHTTGTMNRLRTRTRNDGSLLGNVCAAITHLLYFSWPQTWIICASIYQ